ncbi:MAG TPA: tRNA lysidine(34) synthetase TilS [Burkholderiales bacterium]|nr:tRNA lysidine(34) synthetase TilS [Burkholderiales bacterium]
MASSRKSPKSNALLAHVTAILKQYVKRGDRLVAGLSGGVDSLVLLELLRSVSKTLHFDLAALHVNHQINPSSGRFATFCRAFCKSHAIPLTVVRVTVPRGNSLEAAARAARYQAFAMLPADFIALAHNLDDQAETVFLQLLRGAGVKGLSAMPVIRNQDSGFRIQQDTSKDKKPKKSSSPNPESQILNPRILRPLLEIPRSEIEAYARSRKLEWIEDDSNADTAFDRNFLRHRVLPVVAQRYPSYRKTLLRTSRNFAEAAQLLDELASADAQLTARGLNIAALRACSAARAKNVVRHFLALHGVLMPNAARLDECVRQVLREKRAKRLTIDLDGHTLRRFADELRVVPKSSALARDFTRRWNGESKLHLPELGGTLILKKCRGAGISLAKLSAQPATVRVRQGGERFRPHPRRPRRSLKNLLQEARVPPWLRDRLPLLFVGESLVYVPGIGVDSEFHAAAAERGMHPHWQPD